MLSTKDKAATSVKAATSKKHRNQTQYYSQPECLSSGNTKEKISERLLYLHNPLLSIRERQKGWRLFEASLRRHLAIRDLGVML